MSLELERTGALTAGPGVLVLPAEAHSSAHQVRFEGSVIGEYEVRVYRGSDGPIVVLQEGSTSPLPLEYLSEHAVTCFLYALPNSSARFFERHIVNRGELWVEVMLRSDGFRREARTITAVAAALARPNLGSL